MSNDETIFCVEKKNIEDCIEKLNTQKENKWEKLNCSLSCIKYWGFIIETKLNST